MDSNSQIYLIKSPIFPSFGVPLAALYHFFNSIIMVNF
jgi:hypothetical protein